MGCQISREEEGRGRKDSSSIRWTNKRAVAQKYGKSQVFGCDISPIQPAYVWDNVFFSTGDFEEDWTDYPENAFDFIHMRYTAFSIKDPTALLQRIMK